MITMPDFVDATNSKEFLATLKALATQRFEKKLSSDEEPEHCMGLVFGKNELSAAPTSLLLDRSCRDLVDVLSVAIRTARRNGERCTCGFMIVNSYTYTPGNKEQKRESVLIMLHNLFEPETHIAKAYITRNDTYVKLTWDEDGTADIKEFTDAANHGEQHVSHQRH